MQKNLLILLVSGILLCACGSTRITNTWKSQTASNVQFKKLVVIAMAGEEEKAVRELMEKHLVDDLKARGYNAFCSCETYGPGSFKGMNEKEVLARLSGDGIDGVLTIVLLNKKKEEKFFPGRYKEVPVFWDYYNTVYESVYIQGYYEENTRYYWKSSLFDLRTNQLVTTLESQSFSPKSTYTLAHEYGKLIIKKLSSEGVIGH